MEIKEMAIEQLEERLAAIPAELEKEDADLDALEQEVRDIKEEMETRKATEAQRVEIREQVAAGSGIVTETIQTEERKMSEMEIRNSEAYINAYANYIKTEDPKECRALLTENASGTVAVPDLVYDVVRTAWAREGILSRVRKLYLKGNLKVSFEISATAATNHTEGSGAVSEETLVLGTVTLTPVSIKKWISISDEVKDMRGEEFLRYIYDELTYQIAKKAADNVIAAIEACGTAATATCPAVPVVAATSISVGLVAEAMSKLSDEAANPVVIMNKATWGEFKTAQYAANYPVDPFEGLPVLFNNTIAAYTAATTGVSFMYVGDLGQGVIANFPAGDEIEIKVDETTLMTQDLIRILGREFVGIGVVANDAIVKVTKQ